MSHQTAIMTSSAGACAGNNAAPSSTEVFNQSLGANKASLVESGGPPSMTSLNTMNAMNTMTTMHSINNLATLNGLGGMNPSGGGFLGMGMGAQSHHIGVGMGMGLCKPKKMRKPRTSMITPFSHFFLSFFVVYKQLKFSFSRLNYNLKYHTLSCVSRIKTREILPSFPEFSQCGR